MKVALAQLNYTIGDLENNTAKIIDCIDKAKAQEADLIVFGEQAVSGAPAYDLLNKVSFLMLCEEALRKIAKHCVGISALVGMPAQLATKTISVAALLENGKIQRYIGKKNINRRDEKYFISPSKGCEYVKIGRTKVAVVLGEDIRTESEYGQYADVIVNMSNSQYSRGIIEKRYDYYRQVAFMTGKTVIFINNIGGQTDAIYDGSSIVFNRRGEAISILKNFEEDFVVVDLDKEETPLKIAYQNKTVNVYRAIKLGLGDYFRKNGFKTACLGLSGGIDSAVVVALAAEVLGPENVNVLMMPSQFSSDHSVDDSLALIENLGIKGNIVSIQSVYETVNKSLKPLFGDLPFDVTEENIQSRIRGLFVMAYSNKFGNIVLNTSNKSECAVGYGTMYGDMIGALSILGDLYKTEVYDLARYINRGEEIIPRNIIDKEPSAELRPDHKDVDSLPPYDILDAILYRMIEEGQSREEIINAGFDEADVYKIYNLVLNSEYKRRQACPTLRLSTCTFGKGRIMPLTNKYGL